MTASLEAVDPLRHHGDVEAAPGLLNLAVNVAVDAPPSWLQQQLVQAVPQVARYPNSRPASLAVAEYFAVEPAAVLLTNGASEAFALVAHARSWQAPTVVHPQFAEPDAALHAAGLTPHHVILTAEQRFQLDPAVIPASSDLVMVGNPTNPTSVLHPRDAIHALTCPGRVVVVDEAFMDVAEADHSVLSEAARPGSGLLVIRSWTKTYGLAGVRVGALVGDPALIARCAALQPHWSVNSLAVAAAHAVVSAEGRSHLAAIHAAMRQRRHRWTTQWESCGGEVAARPQASFALLRHPHLPSLHTALRTYGIAARRCDTFPGLSGEHIRVALGDDAALHQLTTAVSSLVSAPSPEVTYAS